LCLQNRNILNFKNIFIYKTLTKPNLPYDIE